MWGADSNRSSVEGSCGESIGDWSPADRDRSDDNYWLAICGVNTTDRTKLKYLALARMSSGKL